MNNQLANAMLAFVCTGPSEGWDPLCNPAHTVLLGLGVLGVFVAVIVGIVMGGRRWLRIRRAARQSDSALRR